MIDKNEITHQLQEWIDQMESNGKHVNLDDINRHLGAYSGDTRSPIPVISVHSVGNLQYRRQS